MNPSRNSVNPFLTLATACISQVCAGTMYWFPAITPGLALALNFSEWQSTVIVAVANCGSVLGIIGGMVNQWYGSRITSSLAALGISISYLSLGLTAILFRGTESYTVYMFVLCFVVLVTTTSYPLYSCSVAASVDVFPARYRGRVVGLNAMTYGGAAGILTSIQAIFFPSPSQTPANLIFVSSCALIVSVVIFFVYPKNAKYDLDGIVPPIDRTVPGERLALQSSSTTPIYDAYISSHIAVGYRIALCLVFALQFNAVCGVIHSPLYVQVIATSLVLTCLFGMLYLPFSTSIRVYTLPTDTESSAGDVTSSSTLRQNEKNRSLQGTKVPSLWYCMTDVRGLYLEASFVILVGGSGMFLLVQTFYLIDALRYGPFKIWSDVETNVIARTIVAIFTAFSVTGRLIFGATIDRGNSPAEREILAFKCLRYNFLAMAVFMLILSIQSKATIILAVVGIGLSYGAYFSVAPTAATLWFGVATFPRNFAVYGAFTSLAAVSLNSSLPAWIRGHTGHWINLSPTSSVCGGLMCSLPTILPSVFLLVIMYILGSYLQPIVQRRAAFQST